MSLDKLNKLNSGSYKYKNPYAYDESKPKPKTQPAYETSGPDRPGTGISDGNSYLQARIKELERQIDNHKFDVVTILLMMNGEIDTNMTLQEVRGMYYDFRAQPFHIMNRISDKLEQILKHDLNINEQTDI